MGQNPGYCIGLWAFGPDLLRKMLIPLAHKNLERYLMHHERVTYLPWEQQEQRLHMPWQHSQTVGFSSSPGPLPWQHRRLIPIGVHWAPVHSSCPPGPSRGRARGSWLVAYRQNWNYFVVVFCGSFSDCRHYYYYWAHEMWITNFPNTNLRIFSPIFLSWKRKQISYGSKKVFFLRFVHLRKWKQIHST